MLAASLTHSLTHASLVPSCPAIRWQPRGRLSSRLMHELQRRTALACVVCDRAAARPFAKWEQLARHVQEAHDQRLCGLCMEVSRGHR